VITVHSVHGSASRSIPVPPDAQTIDRLAEEWVPPLVFVRWSPDGRTLALRSLRLPGDDVAIWLTNADGTNLRRLTNVLVASWFGWRPDSRAIDIVGNGPSVDCPTGRIVDGICRAGFASVDAATGAVAYTTLPGTSGAAPSGVGIDEIAWSPGGDVVAVHTFSGPVATDGSMRNTTRVELLEPSRSQLTTATTGTATLDDSLRPSDVFGEASLLPPTVWTADGRRIVHLAAVPGDASWSIRSVDVRSGRSVLLVPNATGFDLAPT
jgi:dipeptidyl aminopeptidase/acylaminoacyl peptidase